jgi:hypothetical protein
MDQMNDIDITIIDAIKKETFSLDKVLDYSKTLIFSNRLKQFGKIKKYKNYSFDILESLNNESAFAKKLNGIQSCCSLSCLKSTDSDYGRYMDNKKLPSSVYISYLTFYIQRSKTPYETFEELLYTLYKTQKNTNLYSSFIHYYYYTDIDEILKNNNQLDPNDIAFKTAILFGASQMESYKLSSHTIYNKIYDKLIEIIKKIPDSIVKKYNLIERIEQYKEDKMRKLSMVSQLTDDNYGNATGH